MLPTVIISRLLDFVHGIKKAFSKHKYILLFHDVISNESSSGVHFGYDVFCWSMSKIDSES